MFFSDVVVVGLFYFVTIWYCGIVIWRNLFIFLVISIIVMVDINVGVGRGILNHSGSPINSQYFDVTWLFFPTPNGHLSHN